MPGHPIALLAAAAAFAAGLVACAPEAPEPPSPTGDVKQVRVDADSHPRITGVTDIGWTKATGRFTVTMHNDTRASFKSAVLFFTLLSRGVERRTMEYLEYRPAGMPERAWQRVAMNWDDPDEPEDLVSGAVLVDFAPGETETYEIRITLPRRPSLRGFALATQLNAPGNRDQWTRFAVRSRTSQRVRLTGPDTVTPFGGWREFQVEVWTTKRLPRAVRLDLATSPVPSQYVQGTAEFQEFRSGAWHRMSAIPATEDFDLPPGEHRRFRFQYRIGDFDAADRLELGLVAQLRLAGDPPDLGPLAGDGRPIRLIRPSMWVLAPATWPKRVGETVDFRVTVENDTTVAYPAHLMVFRVWPRPPVSQIHYRLEPDQTWRPLPLLPHGQFTDLEESGLPVGARRTYVIRVTMDEQPAKASSWSTGIHLETQIGGLQGIQGVGGWLRLP